MLGDFRAYDCEATGVFWSLGDRPFSLASCTLEGASAFMRAPVDPFTRAVEWKRAAPLEKMPDSRGVVPIFHNALYDMRMLETVGVGTNPDFHDTMAMLHTLLSNEALDLKGIGERWLEIPKDDEKELEQDTHRARKEAKKKGWAVATPGRWGKKPHKADYWLANPDLLKKYNIGDTERTSLFFQLMWTEFESDPRLMKKYREELEIIKVTYKMIGRGVVCDQRVVKFEQQKNKWKEKVHYANVVKAVGHEINLNSPPQLGRYVYEVLGYPVTHRTDGGAPSTDAEALQEIDHPTVKEIVHVKAAQKSNTSFFDQYALLSAKEGNLHVLHPDLRPFGARTGRYSCRTPNLQNVANALNTRSFEPIQARTPFKPRPGMVWFHGDWSQIEMWIFAAESEDEDLLADLATGNLHTETANRVFGRGRDIVKEEMDDGGRSNARARAKMLNFGVVFGMGIPACMDFLKCSRAEAKRNLDLYYTGYRRIKPFMKELSARAEREGFIWNRYGRRLQVPQDMAYKSVNYLVQSSAADHMKAKMIWIDQYLTARPWLNAHMILTVHDELIIEARDTPAMRQALRDIKLEMENIHGLWPSLKNLPVDMAITRTNWAEKQKLEL